MLQNVSAHDVIHVRSCHMVPGIAYIYSICCFAFLIAAVRMPPFKDSLHDFTSYLHAFIYWKVPKLTQCVECPVQPLFVETSYGTRQHLVSRAHPQIFLPLLPPRKLNPNLKKRDRRKRAWTRQDRPKGCESAEIEVRSEHGGVDNQDNDLSWLATMSDDALDTEDEAVDPAFDLDWSAWSQMPITSLRLSSHLDMQRWQFC